MKQNKVIVLTGGIGSGKSTVAKILSERFPVLSADEISREVIEREDVRHEISERLTDRFFRDGMLDRKAFGAWVFAESERTRTLNEIMHGAVLRELCRKIDDIEDRSVPIFVEIPLYTEVEDQFPCDDVWVVAARDEVRRVRIMARDGLSEDEIRDRIARQIPIEMMKSAYTVIENNGDARELRERIEHALSELGRK